jgi:hypothetical protein
MVLLIWYSRGLLNFDHKEADHIRTSHTELYSTSVRNIQYKLSMCLVPCGISASLEMYSISLIATVIWWQRQRNRRLCWVYPLNERRPHFGVFMHLYPDLLQDEEKFTNYFKMVLVFFRKFTCLVRESDVKQHTIYRRAICAEEIVAMCIKWAVR